MNHEDRERAFWDRNAAKYDRVTTGMFGGPMSRVLQLTADRAAGAAEVLEVAAGTGLITAAIAPRVGHVVATDYAEGMLVQLRERMRTAGIANVDAVRRDIYELGFPAARFDVVVAGNVLHLVPDLDRAIDALRYVLRPGGALIVPTFCHDETALAWLVSRLVLKPLGQPMHRRFTAASLRRALGARGLRVVRAETIPGIIPIAYVESAADDSRPGVV